MDIFQDDLPRDFEVPHSPSIPFTGSLEVDGGSFQDYPVRLGLAMSSPEELEMEVGDLYAEHTALLQTWLYFGLIAALSKKSGLEINLSKLIRQQEPGSMVVDYVEVAIFLRRWHSHLDTVLTNENGRVYADSFSQILSISLRNSRLHDFDAFNNGNISSSKPRVAVVLSIKALLRAFYKILLQTRSFDRNGVVFKEDLRKDLLRMNVICG